MEFITGLCLGFFWGCIFWEYGDKIKEYFSPKKNNSLLHNE